MTEKHYAHRDPCGSWPNKIGRLYVVACPEHPGDEPGEDDCVWTISHDPEELGWENDSNFGGYGLPYRVAKALVDIWNEHQS